MKIMIKLVGRKNNETERWTQYMAGRGEGGREAAGTHGERE